MNPAKQFAEENFAQLLELVERAAKLAPPDEPELPDEPDDAATCVAWELYEAAYELAIALSAVRNSIEELTELVDQVRRNFNL